MGVKKILIVDDEASVRRFLIDVFKFEGFAVFEASSGEDALRKLKHNIFDVIVMDICMPGLDGLGALKEMRKMNLKSKVIIMTGYATVRTAVDAMKLGAIDYIVKPFENDELVEIVKSAVSKGNIKDKSQTNFEDEKNSSIVGRSPIMEDIFNQIKKVAITNTTILITGESGTGKSMLAQEIHRLSARAKFPFVTINCAVLPENLLESELFGHEKGAFTGAIAQKTGKFELANKGTVFLDEIGILSPQTQAKLLRVIQDKKFERVGGERFLEVDVRIIAATNENLEEAVASGNFREDLFYRLNVFSILMPSLNQRKEDIPELINCFIERFNAGLGKNIKGISKKALDLLIEYPWPGNIRELENLIQRSMIMAETNEIDVINLPAHIRNINSDKFVKNVNKSSTQLDSFLGNVEKDILVEALNKTGGHRGRAAELLGISRRVMQYKLKKFGMID